MNKSKQIIGALISLNLSVNLIGCEKIFNTSEISSNNESNEYTSTETTTESREITEEDIKKMRSYIDVIVQSLNNKDVENIKKVFDETTLQEITIFDKRMNHVFDMLDSEIIRIEECELVKLEVSKRYKVYASYNVFTKEQELILDVCYIPDSNIEKGGIYAFSLSDFDRADVEYIQGKPFIETIPGIFSSDIQTIEDNKLELWSYYSQVELSIEAANHTAVKLNAVGVEKIETLTADVEDWGGLIMTVTDDLNCKYYIITDEYGVNPVICENDKNGRELNFPYYEIKVIE